MPRLGAKKLLCLIISTLVKQENPIRQEVLIEIMLETFSVAQKDLLSTCMYFRKT